MSNRFEELRGADGILEAYYYYCDNELHREDGPAAVWFYKRGTIESQIWCKHGKLHREDGPAHERFYQNGKLSARMWYRHNKLHCIDGPAYVTFFPNGNIAEKAYCLDGVFLTKTRYLRQASLQKLLVKQSGGSDMTL